VRQRLVPSEPLSSANAKFPLNGWVKVGADNTVTVLMSQAEMGQGSHTGLAMLLAEEMDADWASVRLEQAGLDAIYNNQAVIVDALPFDPDGNGAFKRATQHLVRKIVREIPGMTGTGGSSSMKDQWMPMREAGASARAMLVAAAAAMWRVPASECLTDAGRVVHPSGKRATYGELAAGAAQQALPKHVVLKTPAQFKLIGRPIRRIDGGSKLDGTAAFAIDALPSGLLYAGIVMCPTVGGKAVRFDAEGAMKLKGVKKVVALAPVKGGLAGTGATAGGVAVIADSPFHAMRAVEAVHVEWDHGAAATVSTPALVNDLVQALDTKEGDAHLEKGDVAAALKGAAKTIQAEYRVPFLAHATMEPMNCTVQFKDGSATVWAATQAAGLARSDVAKALGIDASKVHIEVPFLGGGFGRRYFSDCIVQAAMLARETHGAPVQLIWSREQDTTHDFYRPAFVARCRAGLDAQGKLVAWMMTSAGSSMGAPSFIRTSTDGASNTAYAFPNARVAHQTVEAPMTLGIWRSVSHSQNAFFVESFIDEAAAAAEQDPIAFRSALLAGRPRHLRVLRRLSALSGWAASPDRGSDGSRRARGVALHRCFGSVVGQVAEVSVTASKQIRVHRVVCVIDCGIAVNPNLVRQQVESAIVFGLSAALHGEITVDKGQVQQSNFHDYAPIRMSECPEIQTEIIGDRDKPGGVGEAGTPPIAPAVANAVFALTGQRLRSLPLKLA
jgi:isoquinoline 1-oxidoreductase subunit beta